MERLFLDVSIIVVAATVFGLIARALKQPVILAYILAGVVVGPAFLNIINEHEAVQTLSTLGITLLLFLVGIELDLTKLKRLGKVSLLLGMGQVVFTAAIGYILTRLFGIATIPAVYVAIALTFSSTIIVVKLLSEQQALESLYGRIAVGMLLVQDMIAIFALIALSGFTSGNPPTTSEVILIVIRGAMLFSLAILANQLLLPQVFRWLARPSELLLLSSIAWCFIVSMFAASIGFTIEIGAFLAGLSLASLPYNLEIVGRIRSLRDFFITIFFVVLGSQLTLSSLGGLWIAFIVLSIFVLVGNPLIVMVILKALGYRKRTGFLVGLTVAQISEFSLILMALGYKLGHVPMPVVSLVTLIGVITITISSYLIIHGEKIYRRLSMMLSAFESARGKAEDAEISENLIGHTVVFGYHRLGERIVRELQRLGSLTLVVDFDPEIIHSLKQRNVACIYGDISDLDMHERAQLVSAKMIISTVPDLTDNLTLLADLKKKNPGLPVFVTATTWEDTQALYEAGADYVIFPHYLSGEHFSHLLQNLHQNPNAIKLDRERIFGELTARYGANLKG